MWSTCCSVSHHPNSNRNIGIPLRKETEVPDDGFGSATATPSRSGSGFSCWGQQSFSEDVRPPQLSAPQASANSAAQPLLSVDEHAPEAVSKDVGCASVDTVSTGFKGADDDADIEKVPDDCASGSCNLDDEASGCRACSTEETFDDEARTESTRMRKGFSHSRSALSALSEATSSLGYTHSVLSRSNSQLFSRSNSNLRTYVCADAAVQTDSLDVPLLCARCGRPPKPASRMARAQGAFKQISRLTAKYRSGRSELTHRPCVLPHFAETPSHTQMMCLFDTLEHINPRGDGCCPYHIALASISLVLKDMSKHDCLPDFSPCPGWQCSTCLAMNGGGSPRRSARSSSWRTGACAAGTSTSAALFGSTDCDGTASSPNDEGDDGFLQCSICGVDRTQLPMRPSVSGTTDNDNSGCELESPTGEIGLEGLGPGQEPWRAAYLHQPTPQRGGIADDSFNMMQATANVRGDENTQPPAWLLGLEQEASSPPEWLLGLEQEAASSSHQPERSDQAPYRPSYVVPRSTCSSSGSSTLPSNASESSSGQVRRSLNSTDGAKEDEESVGAASNSVAEWGWHEDDRNAPARRSASLLETAAQSGSLRGGAGFSFDIPLKLPKPLALYAPVAR